MRWTGKVQRYKMYLLPIISVATVMVIRLYVTTTYRSLPKGFAGKMLQKSKKSVEGEPKIEKKKLDLPKENIKLGPKMERVYHIPTRLPMNQRRTVEKVINSVVTLSSYTSYVDEANQTYPITLRGDYEIDNNDICSGISYIDALVLVHSGTTNFDRRTNIRQSYGLRETFLPAEVRVVFLLGLPSNHDVQDLISKEKERYHDIIQGKFKDTYHNLTNKAVMGLRWVTENCQNAKYVIKMDDDVIFDMWKFLRDFPKNKTGEYIWCNIFRHEKIQRTDKWAVPSSIFKGLSHYPWPYCPGLLVILRTEVIPKLFKAAFLSPFFWIDDVYVYGILRDRAGGIPLHRFPPGFAVTHVQKILRSHSSNANSKGNV